MKRFFSFVLLAIGFFNPLFSCTDFLIQAQDGSCVNGRSLEFAAKLPTNLVIQPANEKVQTQAPGNQPGLSWVSQYAYVGVTAVHPDLIADGLNEKGLSFGGLLLPTSVYQKVALSDAQKALPYELVGKWVLGNFSTVQQVKQAITKIRVWKGPNPNWALSVPLHFSIHDTSGDSVVLEYVNGQLNIYDNEAQVLTNYPTFDWHINNLKNYLNLSPINAPSLSVNQLNLNFPGQGTGLLGMPGGYTPPDRFVRIFYSKAFAHTPSGAKEASNLAFHFLNTVDIPYGVVEEAGSSSAQLDFTQWIVVKDMTNLIFYFRTYDNQNIFQLNLKQLDLTKNYPPVSIFQPSPNQNANALFTR